jgi:dephospho-CoA kinase
MFLVGLTGGVAAGKSSAANIFRELGVPIIDADAIAREIVEPGEAAYNEIRYYKSKLALSEKTIFNINGLVHLYLFI